MVKLQLGLSFIYLLILLLHIPVGESRPPHRVRTDRNKHEQKTKNVTAIQKDKKESKQLIRAEDDGLLSNDSFGDENWNVRMLPTQPMGNMNAQPIRDVQSEKNTKTNSSSKRLGRTLSANSSVTINATTNSSVTTNATTNLSVTTNATTNSSVTTNATTNSTIVTPARNPALFPTADDPYPLAKNLPVTPQAPWMVDHPFERPPNVSKTQQGPPWLPVDYYDLPPEAIADKTKVEYLNQVGDRLLAELYPQIHSDPVEPEPTSKEIEEYKVYEGYETYNIIHITKEQIQMYCPYPCRVYNRFFPVCGTDGNTYHNLGVLGCAQKCNKKLGVKSFVHCPGAVEVTTTTLPPPTTTLFPIQVELPNDMEEITLMRLHIMKLFGQPGFRSTHTNITEYMSVEGNKWWWVWCSYMRYWCHDLNFDEDEPWQLLNMKKEKVGTLPPRVSSTKDPKYVYWSDITTPKPKIKNLKLSTNY